MKKYIVPLMMNLVVVNQAVAGSWVVGQQSTIYTSAHTLGDGSDAHGGEAPYFSANEPVDTPTNSTIVTNWTKSGVGQYDASPTGHEAKARFDCNIAFHEKNDPILAPGVLNGSTHDHSFFGGLAFAGNAHNITYSGLRSGGGYSTCYGGPMNLTLYWEPSMMVTVNGVTAVLKPFNIITYYICGDAITYTGASFNYGPPNCTRWPRGLDMVFGFNMSDPNENATQSRVTAANAAGGNYQPISERPTWSCIKPATPSYTSYAPNQSQGASQPYINDGAGHETLNCTATLSNGITNCTIGTVGCGYAVFGDIVSRQCWDGKNPTSPNGRDHLIQKIQDNNIGKSVCPDNWFLIPHFEAKPTFLFTSLAEMQNAYLSSDRMPGMPFKGGESLHADLIPAWDYGTGNNPGFMVKFFQHCLGLNMHLKNSDNVTFTDLVGDPHECGYGRIDASTNTYVNEAPPAADSNGPNPVVNLTPDQSGAKRYFSLSTGTALPGSVVNQNH